MEKADIKTGARVEMKRPHPCGNKTFVILRVGMDVALKCETCGRVVRFSRRDAEKYISGKSL
jgi:hypothetical protein